MNSILVIRLSSLGDVILSTGLVRQLRRTYPNAVIDVAVNHQYAEVWNNNPHVRTVWPITFSNSSADVDAVKLSMHESLNGDRYDLVVDLQNNIRSAMLRRGLYTRVRKVRKHRLEKLMLVYAKIKPRKTTPIVERYRKTVEHLPLAFDVEGPELWLREEAEQGYYTPGVTSGRAPYSQHVHAEPAKLTIGLAPGAKHFTKRWPVEKWIELCDSLRERGYVPVLLGGTHDVENNNQIEIGCSHSIVRADGASTLQQTICAVNECTVVVSNDSAVMHVAAARRVPVVAIFGSSVRELGFAPVGLPSRIVEHNVACRPCSHIGRSSCPKQHFQCMNGINVAEVIQAIQELLV
jgi:lipopolysaccharide heptosyltransferase II